MQPDRRDSGLLFEMLSFCDEIGTFVRGFALAQYLDNREKRRAVERVVGLIGEAAAKVSDSFRNAHQEIPWPQIIGLRHVIVHGYAVLDDKRVWEVATNDVPRLRDELQRLGL